MKYLFIGILSCISFILSAQDNFYGDYSDLTFKVDDYVYIGSDSLVISSVEPYELDKCRIKVSDYSFSIDDGGFGFKSKKVLQKVIKVKDGLSLYTIKGLYGDKWNVVKSTIGDEAKVIGVFHARQEKQPVANYTLFSDKKISRSDISNIVLQYLSIEHENILDYTLMEVDKYEISDHPEIAKFIKGTMGR